MSLAKRLQEAFLAKERTLALAESCTGGAIAANLVQIPDASLYFLGSLVAYTNEIKQTLLGVKGSTLKSHGAVSALCAREMALGVLKQFGSDIALSVTGVAGPTGGSQEKPVGLVYFALASKGREPNTWSVHFKGDRAAIIKQACQEALENILAYV